VNPLSAGAGRMPVRFAKFASVGVVVTLGSLAVFNALALGVRLHATPAWALAYSAGIGASYALNRVWTFSDRAHLPHAHTAPRFVATSLGGLAVSTAAVALLRPVAEDAVASGLVPPGLALNAVAFAGIAVSLAWNYTFSSRWAFSAGDAGSTDSE